MKRTDAPPITASVAVYMNGRRLDVGTSIVTGTPGQVALYIGDATILHLDADAIDALAGALVEARALLGGAS